MQHTALLTQDAPCTTHHEGCTTEAQSTQRRQDEGRRREAAEQMAEDANLVLLPADGAIIITRMAKARIDIPKDEIAEFCRRNHIRRLALFGSVLREDFTPESDVDVLVEFEPYARVGLMGLARMEIELGRLLGRKVDLNTPGFLSEYFRDEVLSEAEIISIDN